MKQIFTWWNRQTFGTFLKTIFLGRLVGKDKYGNKYYQSKKDERWVVYSKNIEATKITSDWFSWMHHITNIVPSEKELKKYSWQKPHKDNKTGTEKAYKPNKISKKSKNFKKYETWKP